MQFFSYFLYFLSAAAFVTGLRAVIIEQKKWADRPADWHYKRKELVSSISIICTILFMGGCWAAPDENIVQNNASSNVILRDTSTQTPFLEETQNLPYRISEAQSDAALTTITVKIPKEYSENDIRDISSKIYAQGWPNEHVAVTFHIEGDSLNKIINYATAIYYSEDMASQLQIGDRDSNNKPFNFNFFKDSYDSDSTKYYKKH